MKLITALSLFVALATMLPGCESPPPSVPISAAAIPAAGTASEPMLRMQVDGKLWQANREIFGAVNPLGAKNSILISDSFGPNDASEQDLTMTLTGVSSPGSFSVKNAKPGGSVVQLMNLSAERTLIGGLMFDHDIQVEISQLQADPVLIAGKFAGWMQASDGSKIIISAGEFFYEE